MSGKHSRKNSRSVVSWQKADGASSSKSKTPTAIADPGPNPNPQPTLGSGKYAGSVRLWIASGSKYYNLLGDLKSSEKEKIGNGRNWGSKAETRPDLIVYGQSHYPMRILGTVVSQTDKHADVVAWQVYSHRHRAYADQLQAYRKKDANALKTLCEEAHAAWAGDLFMQWVNAPGGMASCMSIRTHTLPKETTPHSGKSEQADGQPELGWDDTLSEKTPKTPTDDQEWERYSHMEDLYGPWLGWPWGT